jgi:hypothetical protein
MVSILNYLVIKRVDLTYTKVNFYNIIECRFFKL